jgi:hypothetical protein
MSDLTMNDLANIASTARRALNEGNVDVYELVIADHFWDVMRLAEQVGTLRDSLAAAEAELARLAPFLAAHNVFGYSFGGELPGRNYTDGKIRDV